MQTGGDTVGDTDPGRRQAHVLHPREQHLADQIADVAIVDIHLGEESGFDLAEQLHRHATTVILISSYSADDFGDMLTKSPAVGFLSIRDLSGGAVEHAGGA